MAYGASEIKKRNEWTTEGGPTLEHRNVTTMLLLEDCTTEWIFIQIMR